MNQTIALRSPDLVRERPRRIAVRTHGRRHGPITRLMSPGDLGELLKPFVFLDLFDIQETSFPNLGLHPHSGIATLTHLFEGAVRYEDTTGATGILPEGGVEWFKAGHGAWHGGGSASAGRTRGFQLWVALSPEHELGPVESIYQAPEDIARDGPARVLLGAHGAAGSPLEAPASMNYLAVQLEAGQSWRYQPPAGHTVTWMALATGAVATPEPVEAGELVVFSAGDGAIDIQAESNTELVLGSAVPHPHDLALGYYSVHTSPATLAAGERRIDEIRARLEREGRLRP
ncbi:MAG: Pirin domain protein [Caulobacteraceae bacterium]|jgi:redox-sensitive bicupin YhaK (pirin superfamily)|nr:Pirin domain protein [Caulobacteraceae bacterium]